MNIFVLDQDPVLAAQLHCDKHNVKMILEYGQLLSTAHRLLDGTPKVLQYSNRKKKIWELPGEISTMKHVFDDEGNDKFVLDVQNRQCYTASHMQHPGGVWARASDQNYRWLFTLFDESLREYTHRYKKTHAAARIQPFLSKYPRNISAGEMTPFALSMPIQYKVDDAVQSYQNYYMGDKIRFAKWTNREVPDWFVARLPKDRRVADFSRTR